MMDGWVIWKVVRWFGAITALLLLCVSMVSVWRVRGILNWKQSLRKEFNRLLQAAGKAHAARRRAIEVVLENCNRAWRATSPDLGTIPDLSNYIRSIAGCFHPEAENPELRITVGHFIKAARESADRLELILNRSGFKRLRRVRIRHIRQSYEWYQRTSRLGFVKFLYRFRDTMLKIYHARLVILPDPFSWLAYFSNRLTMLVLTRCLMMDVFLFVGTLAVDAYDETAEGYRAVYQAGELEKTLEDLDTLENAEPFQTDPQIQKIRDRLVGISAFLFSTPGLRDWKAALTDTAALIAANYFPSAACPLEEAAIGPLLHRSRVWIRLLCETENIKIVKRLHRVRLESLYNMKSISDIVMSGKALNIARKTWGLYRWMKWPLKIYRWTKKTSPLKISADVGWILAQKGFINFAFRYTFDTACRELDAVYRLSLPRKAP